LTVFLEREPVSTSLENVLGPGLTQSRCDAQNRDLPVRCRIQGMAQK
jgi:hypothetical protein